MARRCCPDVGREKAFSFGVEQGEVSDPSVVRWEGPQTASTRLPTNIWVERSESSCYNYVGYIWS